MSWFKHDCKTDGHNYQARFEERYNENIAMRLTSVSGSMDCLKEKRYVHDICTYCGHKINRSNDGKPE